MTHQPPENSPRNIWQNQKRENASMSIQEIRDKLRRLHSRIRWLQLGTLPIAILVVVLFGRGFLQSYDLLSRIGWGSVIAGSLYLLYELLRSIQLRALPGDAPLTTSLQFYRGTLERQRGYYRRLKWALAPLLIGLLLLTTQVGLRIMQDPNVMVSLRAILPFCVLAIAWGILTIVLRRRRHNWLQREFELLDALEKENQ